MTAANFKRDSILLGQVFEKSDDMSKDDQTHATESPSDSDLSTHNASVSSRGSILRVATLEESLAHLDIERDGATPEKEQDTVVVADNVEEDTDNAMDGSSKSVTFTDVSVREYPFCLGDNPATIIGAPLTIEWEAQSEGKLSLDDYETSRPDRRRSDELRIPAFVREEMLRNNGYSRLDIQKGVRDANIARNRRKRSNEMHRLDKAQEVAERLVRGTLNATVRRQKKKQEKELIDHFRTEADALRENVKAVRRSTWSAASPSNQVQRRRASEPLEVPIPETGA